MQFLCESSEFHWILEMNGRPVTIELNGHKKMHCWQWQTFKESAQSRYLEGRKRYLLPERRNIITASHEENVIYAVLGPLQPTQASAHAPTSKRSWPRRGIYALTDWSKIAFFLPLLCSGPLFIVAVPLCCISGIYQVMTSLYTHRAHYKCIRYVYCSHCILDAFQLGCCLMFIRCIWTTMAAFWFPLCMWALVWVYAQCTLLTPEQQKQRAHGQKYRRGVEEERERLHVCLYGNNDNYRILLFST